MRYINPRTFLCHTFDYMLLKCENELRCVVYGRATPDKVGIQQVAEQLRKFNIHGLLIVGGFEVNSVRFTERI